MTQRVTSTWDTGEDGEPRRGVIIDDFKKEGARVKWDDGKEESVDRADIIKNRKEEGNETRNFI